MACFYVVWRATPTGLFSAAAVADWAATAPAAEALAELVLAAMDSLAWSFLKRIVITASVCRKLDKREQRRRQNPNLFDTKKHDRAQTR